MKENNMTKIKKLIIVRDKTKYNKKFYDMKIVKSFATTQEATEYLFRDIPNGICNGLNCSLDDVRQVINVLWYDYADTWILDNHTLKIKNPTKILKENQ